MRTPITEVALNGPITIAGHLGTEERPPDYPVPLEPGILNLGTIHPLRQKDITVLVKRELLEKELSARGADASIVSARKSLDFSATIEFALGKTKEVCRVHAALAFGGEYYSVTIRGFKVPKKVKLKKWETSEKWACDDAATAWLVRLGIPKARARGMLCRPYPEIASRKESIADGFLTGQHRLGELMYETIFASTSIPGSSGLVLVTGATASGKTQAMNYMVFLYLCGLYRKTRKLKRRPHVVALGDPIETLFFQKTEDAGLSEIAEYQIRNSYVRAFDLTARILGKDAASVSDALKDALRETPSAYIISELRSTQDFRAALEFAATGHLVFATAHSTSLVDAMARLVEVYGAQTPSGRSALAQRLKAIAHLRPIEDVKNEKGMPLGVTLPATWVGDSVGVRNFVADGLASLLPRGKSRYTSPGAAAPRGVHGIAYAAERLKEIEHAYVSLTRAEERIFADVIKRAHEMDLEK
jgi:hypothetical protein